MRRLVHSVIVALMSFAVVIGPAATVAAPVAAAVWCQTVTSHITYRFTVLNSGADVARGTTMNSENICWDSDSHITSTGTISFSGSPTLGSLTYWTKNWHDLFFTGNYIKGAYVTWKISGSYSSWTCDAQWSHENIFDPVNGGAITWDVRAVVDSTSTNCTNYYFTNLTKY